MYYIKKYANCWVIFNDNNGNSRKLTAQEVEAAKKELPELKNPQVVTVYSDCIQSIKEKP
jgi:type II secretory pathway component PulC